MAKGFRQRAWHPAADPRLVACEEHVTRRNRLDVFKSLLQNAQWPDADALAAYAPLIMAGSPYYYGEKRRKR